ncbi:DoxX family protein [uncultured Aquimarina sp.]|uniref:DoxX family protein n=1 Tax=uncultured Aquimarina sp. TaxID=575652 RepID=UPI00262869C7|nr:DoxX family protein [uncultured Aquimarina sp.]
MKRDKVIYWLVTGIVSFLFASGGLMYFLNYDYAHQFFISLGFPTWIIYPLAVLKILGPIAILTKKSSFLKELAYAGFLFDAVLAVSAHLIVGDGFIYHGFAAIILTIVSWRYDRKLFGEYVQKIATKSRNHDTIYS